MSDLPRRCCAYAGNSNMNACRQYTCPPACAPTRKIGSAGGGVGSLVSRAKNGRGAVERPKNYAFRFFVTKTPPKGVRFPICRREAPPDLAPNKQDPRGGRGRFGIRL